MWSRKDLSLINSNRMKNLKEINEKIKENPMKVFAWAFLMASAPLTGFLYFALQPKEGEEPQEKGKAALATFVGLVIGVVFCLIFMYFLSFI